MVKLVNTYVSQFKAKSTTESFNTLVTNRGEGKLRVLSK